MHRGVTCQQRKKNGGDHATANVKKHGCDHRSTTTKKAKTSEDLIATSGSTATPSNNKPNAGLSIGGHSYHLHPKRPRQPQHRGLKRPHGGPNSGEGGGDRAGVDIKIARADSPTNHAHSEEDQHDEVLPTPLEVPCMDQQGGSCCKGSHDGDHDDGHEGESVIAQCIRRFRDQPAMSREERDKLRSGGSTVSTTTTATTSPIPTRGPRQEDFWWQSPQSRSRGQGGHEGLRCRHDEREENDSSEYVFNGSIDDHDTISLCDDDKKSLSAATHSPLVDEPMSSLTSHDEMWARGRGDRSAVGEAEVEEDEESSSSSLRHDIHEEQRALECGDGSEPDLDSRAEALLQKCKSVLKDFYMPEPLHPATKVATDEDEEDGDQYLDRHSSEDEAEESGAGGDHHDDDREDEDQGNEGDSHQQEEVSGYVDQLLGDALNLSLEKPEEAVRRLRARLGLSKDEGERGGEEDNEGKQQGQEDEEEPKEVSPMTEGKAKEEEEEEVEVEAIPAPIVKPPPPPPPPSAFDVMSAVMELSPLPPLPSPRDHDPYMDEFSFLPSSPMDSTRATLDSSSTVTDVSLDITPGDLRCFEDEGVDVGLKPVDSLEGSASSLFELSSSSESGSFTGGFLDQRPPFFAPRPTHDPCSPPPKAVGLLKPLTISIPQSTTGDMLRVRRSPSNSPRRRDDGSAFYYVPESTCAIARCLVTKAVHRNLFVPCGARFAISTQEGPQQEHEQQQPQGDATAVTTPRSPSPPFSKSDLGTEAGQSRNTSTVPQGRPEPALPASSKSSNSSSSNNSRSTGAAMEVEGGHKEEEEVVEVGEEEEVEETTDDNALIEGHMYDSDPIVHALRRRARELKGLLGVM